MAASGSALALAARLRALDDAALARLVTQRGVRDSGIRDFFDLAEALLDRTSVQSALERLDRGTLALLAVAGELAESSGAPTADQLSARLELAIGDVRERIATALEAGLLGAESGRYAPWDAVVEQLRAWPAFGLPASRDLESSSPPAVLEPVSETDVRFIDRGAGDRAFGTLGAVTETLLALRDAPARRLTRGGLALPDARRLAGIAGVDASEVELLLDIAARAGLTVLSGTEWVPTQNLTAWLAGSRVDRWAELANGWLSRLPDDLRELLRTRAHAVWGDGLLDYLAWLYPAGGAWIRERAAAAAREAELLGITGAGAPSTAGSRLLLDGTAAAAEAMAESFPPEVDQVYLQHDLTVIAPGPLRVDLETRLRGLAEAEARGVASSFRITAVSLTRAFVAGETADGLRAFLTALSLTGIPQPLEYLIADTAARFGTLRVGRLEEAAGAYVRSDDTGLLRQLAVDQALTPLGLEASGIHRLITRFDVGLLYTALLDARYPVVAEDSEGEIVAMRAERRASSGGGGVSDDTAALLISRVRHSADAAPEEADRAWLARQLELAIKGKVTVTVTVRLPDDSLADYVLEPAALAGGRLRARDRRADIERTLPLASIVSVSDAP
ncbi:helicase-associated domain-containing protein [Pseudolysinimonas sp.]|uniref:helicase-associated domain-containing protein n=1 Tax=Pseudolysinimonas sp. TaxID=2680009 RepID=UPI00286C5ADB|nr:helicase-associated domain-containing protein [Pseudolysinimonas sp.]